MSKADFERHASEIVGRPNYFGMWTFGHGPDDSPQLEKVILDKYRRVVCVFIRPRADYPRTPPRVVTKPSIHDQCFQPYSGELQWARASDTERVIWNEYDQADNPLAVLIDELRCKYHIF
jgi:hypothetical protein